jgi:predicted transcriptional regulator
MKQKNEDPLKAMRDQVEQLIRESYRTVEEFCWDKDLSKATVSNFLHGKKDFQVSTLAKIAKALGKKVSIRIE